MKAKKKGGFTEREEPTPILNLMELGFKVVASGVVVVLCYLFVKEALMALGGFK